MVPLGGRGLQVVEVAGFFLELRHAFAHVVEQAQASAWPKSLVMSSRPCVKLRTISLMPFTPSVLKWLRSVPRYRFVGNRPWCQPLDQLALGLQALFAQFHQAVERGQTALLHRPHANSPGVRS